jgi:hypothetical protein
MRRLRRGLIVRRDARVTIVVGLRRRRRRRRGFTALAATRRGRPTLAFVRRRRFRLAIVLPFFLLELARNLDGLWTRTIFIVLLPLFLPALTSPPKALYFDALLLTPAQSALLASIATESAPETQHPAP